MLAHYILATIYCDTVAGITLLLRQVALATVKAKFLIDCIKEVNPHHIGVKYSLIVLRAI